MTDDLNKPKDTATPSFSPPVPPVPTGTAGKADDQPAKKPSDTKTITTTGEEIPLTPPMPKAAEGKPPEIKTVTEKVKEESPKAAEEVIADKEKAKKLIQDLGGKGDEGGPKPKSSGKGVKVVLGVLALLVMVGAVLAATGLVQIPGIGETRSPAKTTNDINATITVRQGDLDNCKKENGGPCKDDATCGVRVSRFKCDSNNLPQGCQQNGVVLDFIKRFVNVNSKKFGFVKSQTCGTQQIDYGCKDDLGTYGYIGFLSYIGPNSCNGSNGGSKCSADSDAACVDKDPRESCGNNKECKKDGSNTGSDGKPICKCRNISTPPPSTPSCDVNLRPNSATLNIGSTRVFTADVTDIRNGTVGRVEFTVLSTNPDRLSVNPPRDNSSPYKTTATALNPGTPRIKAEVWMGGQPRCSDTSTITIPRPDELVCTGLNFTPAEPVLGSSVTFTCRATGAAVNHHVFQYSLNGSGFTRIPESSRGSGQTVPFEITEAGDYVVRCRACSSSDNSKCTAYQNL